MAAFSGSRRIRRTDRTLSQWSTPIPASASYASVVGFTELPHLGDELHHFGWNACSSALCPTGSHTHGDRRYLVVPGIRSSRIYILDTRPDPASPQVVNVLGRRNSASGQLLAPAHRALRAELPVRVLPGRRDGDDGPGGVALLDHSTFDVLGQFEADRGDQYLAYDVWWHINHDVMVTSEWATPSMIEDGVVPECCWAASTATTDFWDMNTRRHAQTVIWVTSTRWRWSYGPPRPGQAVRLRRGGGVASRTCPPRSGSGTGRTASGRPPR